MQQNILYLTVLPLFHMGPGLHRTEEVLTLFPSRDFATQFFQDEVDQYIDSLWHRLQQLRGGHVTGYALEKEDADEGRVIVRVIQNVG